MEKSRKGSVICHKFQFHATFGLLFFSLSVGLTFALLCQNHTARLPCCNFNSLAACLPRNVIRKVTHTSIVIVLFVCRSRMHLS